MSRRAHYPPCVNRTGLSILHHPISGEPAYDIIFVHGLQGHPRGTWAKKVNESHAVRHYPPANNTGVDETGSSACCNSGDIFWPGHILPHDLPNCRILSWGYDTFVTRGWSSTNQNNLFAHAKDFLFTLERSRPLKRPIIFLAHSLGGIMVKEVLRRSEISREPTLQDIINSTVGIVFFGTPHRGSPGLANLAETVRRTASLILRVDSNSTILRVLGVDSPELELCHESFITQWRERNFRVKTFQEAYGLVGVNITRYSGKVVPDASSLLGDPREHAESISANHMDMVRFADARDVGYRNVLGELCLIIQASEMRNHLQNQQIQSNNVNTASSSTTLPTLRQNDPNNNCNVGSQNKLSPQDQECLQKLAYAEMTSRQHNIHSEMQGTCQWILTDPVFVAWKACDNINSHNGLLWIKGKPGAGKSVMMKKILRTVQNEKLATESIASFFFNARGSELERSILGMFRSLVHQVLLQDTALRREFTLEYLERCQSIGKQWEYMQTELQEFLLRSLSRRRSKSIQIFIDALDECKEDEVREVAYYLRELTDRASASGSTLNVCISSRRYPTITIVRCPEIDLEKGNSGDITKYIETRMQQHNSHYYLQHLKSRVTERANSVFLWAILVVDMIHRSWDSGNGVAEIETLIQETPGQVKDLFEQLTATFTADECKEACQLFQWTLFGNNSRSGALTVEAVQYFMLFGTKGYSSFTQLHQSEGVLSIDAFRRRVTYFSRGLIETVYSSSTETFIMQVIHETVRDWLLHENGFRQLDMSIRNARGDGEVALVNTCVKILLSEDYFPIHPKRGKLPTQKNYLVGQDGGPFWHGSTPLHIPNISSKATVCKVTWYAIDSILILAKSAETNGSLPVKLLDMLNTRTKLWEVLVSADTTEFLWFHPPDHSPLTLLCSYGFTESLSYLVSHDTSGFNKVSSFSFKAALGSDGAAESVEALIRLCSVKELRDSRGASALHWLFNIKTYKLSSILKSLGEPLLDTGLSINARDDEGKSVLWTVVSQDDSIHVPHQDLYSIRFCLTWLFSHGLNPNIVDNRGKSIVHEVISRGVNITVLKILLSHGCLPSIADHEGQTPLHVAVIKEEPEITRILLDAGSPVDVEDSTGTTPMHLAAVSTNVQVLNKLINAEANVNVQNKYGQTPLHLAAKTQAAIFLEMMIGRGADTHVKDKFGMSAQDVAEMNDRDDYVLEILSPG